MLGASSAKPIQIGFRSRGCSVVIAQQSTAGMLM
jgi:hypothetical protein